MLADILPNLLKVFYSTINDHAATLMDAKDSMEKSWLLQAVIYSNLYLHSHSPAGSRRMLVPHFIGYHTPHSATQKAFRETGIIWFCFEFPRSVVR